MHELVEGLAWYGLFLAGLSTGTSLFPYLLTSMCPRWPDHSLSYSWSIARSFSRCFSEMCERSRCTALESSSTSQDSDSLTLGATKWPTLWVLCWLPASTILRISPISRSTATIAFGCSKATTTSWLRRIGICTPSMLTIGILKGTSGSMKRTAVAQVSCALEYILGLDVSRIILFVWSFHLPIFESIGTQWVPQQTWWQA